MEYRTVPTQLLAIQWKNSWEERGITFDAGQYGDFWYIR